MPSPLLCRCDVSLNLKMAAQFFRSCSLKVILTTTHVCPLQDSLRTKPGVKSSHVTSVKEPDKRLVASLVIP